MSHHPEQIKEYIRRAIEQIEPVDGVEIEDKKKIKNFLVLHPKNFYDRKNFKGHITTSGIIFYNNQIILIHHKKLNKWLQPGGHCDEGEMPYETALREIKEETGLIDLTPRHINENNEPLPYYCNVHQIPQRGDEQEHRHLDLLYIFDAKNDVIKKNHESKEIKWFRKDEAERINKTIKKILLKLAGRIII